MIVVRWTWRIVEFLAVLVIGGMVVAIYDSDLWG